MQERIIPNENQADLKNGNWFILSDGENRIQIWSSNMNGMEKVYLNDKLVSEIRNLKTKSAHNFKDNSGVSYEVAFQTKHILKSAHSCTVKKDGTVLKTFNIKYFLGKRFTPKRVIILVVVSVLFGILKTSYNLSNTVFAIFLFAVMIVHFITQDKGKFVIEEEDPSN